MSADARAEAERYARADLGMAADEPNEATGFQKQVEFAEAVHHFTKGAQWQASRPFTDEDVEVMAKHMAHVALDWVDFETLEHIHDLECTNWAAYVDDARAALDAVTARHTKGDGA